MLCFSLTKKRKTPLTPHSLQLQLSVLAYLSAVQTHFIVSFFPVSSGATPYRLSAHTWMKLILSVTNNLSFLAPIVNSWSSSYLTNLSAIFDTDQLPPWSRFFSFIHTLPSFSGYCILLVSSDHTVLLLSLLFSFLLPTQTLMTVVFQDPILDPLSIYTHSIGDSTQSLASKFCLHVDFQIYIPCPYLSLELQTSIFKSLLISTWVSSKHLYLDT